MNPFDLSASDLLIWGIVAHLIADWPLQSDWMANNKMKRASEWVAPGRPGYQQALEDTRLYFGVLFRHPAAYVHAGVHAVALGLVFGYWPGMALGLAHLLIDTRVPVAWFSKVMRQTQPGPPALWKPRGMGYEADLGPKVEHPAAMLMDLGTTVRFWTDQVWHIATIALAALLVAA